MLFYLVSLLCVFALCLCLGQLQASPAMYIYREPVRETPASTRFSGITPFPRLHIYTVLDVSAVDEVPVSPPCRLPVNTLYPVRIRSGLAWKRWPEQGPVMLACTPACFRTGSG